MNKWRWAFILLMSFTLVVGIFTTVSSANEISVLATVSDEGVLETENGEVLEVAETEMGDELLKNIDQKVEVMGELTEEDGVKIIRVTDFSIIDQ